MAEQTVSPSAQAQDLGILARERLANGYLSGKYRAGAGASGPADWRSAMHEHEVKKRLSAVERIRAAEVPARTPMAEWAIDWCLRNPAVHAVVTGTKSVEQLESSARAVELDVSRPT